jgi:hypothetical protein
MSHDDVSTVLAGLVIAVWLLAMGSFIGDCRSESKMRPLHANHRALIHETMQAVVAGRESVKVQP